MSAPIPAHVPASTYRLQLSGSFPFSAAGRLAPYLERLGITDCYCSPVLFARSGSAHGYDICDHTRFNSDIGGDEGFHEFSAALRACGLGLVLDFVPNHMSTDPGENQWWRAVLENGPSSPFARFFDIDWAPVKDELKGKVLLPVLPDQYGVALEGGHLQIELRDGTFSLRCFHLDLPLNPREMRRLLRHNLEALESTHGKENPDVVELRSIIFHLDHLPVYTDTRDDMVASRHREKEVARHRLSQLLEASPTARQHVEDNIRVFNGVPGVAGSFDLLHDLLERQAYRLSSWRTAMHEINYRRFFDINELAGIRVEEPEVFNKTHTLVAELVSRGDVSGLRLDHVDGLFDPASYLERLAQLVGLQPIYVVAEKILSGGEPLRAEWRLHGTTGYDFKNQVNGLFVDSRRAHDFARLYARFTGRGELFADVVYTSKKLVMTTSMGSELNVLAHELNRISESDRRFRDFTLDSLQEAMREVVACFPVYRTYFSASGCNEFDNRTIDAAVSEAVARNPATEPSIFQFIRRMLLPAADPQLPEEEYKRRVRFAMKFQQYTGPVQAKGVEDTAFYRHAPLLSLNEVGGNPARFGCSPEEFHHANKERRKNFPLAMLASSTHDSKHGEDARARINVLSEIPEQWRAAVSRWARVNATARTVVRGEPAPARSDEYLFYQALLGAWPADLVDAPDEAFVERMRVYMQKAVKEAKVYTSWINPSRDYDEAVSGFVRSVLAGRNSRSFLRLFLPFAERIARLGALNSLSQLVLKIGSPGIPDFYRGAELWDLDLVDPDNRRSVDFDLRAAWLERMEPILRLDTDAAVRLENVAEMFRQWQDGRIKLYVTAAGLRLRRRWRDVFLSGDYLPLAPEGELAGHIVGFVRNLRTRSVVVLAPRLVASLPGSGTTTVAGDGAWRGTCVRLPMEPGCMRYQNLFTGEDVHVQTHDQGMTICAADVFRTLPVAILFSERQEVVER